MVMAGAIRKIALGKIFAACRNPILKNSKSYPCEIITKRYIEFKYSPDTPPKEAGLFFFFYKMRLCCIVLVVGV